MARLKIAILNSSPKADNSITLHYIKYIQKHIPQHDYIYINVGSRINTFEDENCFNDIIDLIKKAEGVIWVFPVYYCMVPYQLKRFIELIYEKDCTKAFRGKYSTSISTSAHFYDHTAHNYMHAVCNDLMMIYLEGFSAHIQDLLISEQRSNLLGFAKYFFNHIEDKIFLPLIYEPLKFSNIAFDPCKIDTQRSLSSQKMVILTDADSKDINLTIMLNTFIKCFLTPLEIVNLRDYDIKGGCIACGRCFHTGKCQYHDDFEVLFYEKLQPAHIIIFAGKMQDRYLSSLWKKFFDRNFFNGHRPVLKGKRIAYIISGPLRQNSNLRQFLEAIAQTWETPLIDILTDEANTSAELTKNIESLANKVLLQSDCQWERPRTFLGEGGHKIFRDLVYSRKGLMKLDHEFYKNNGFYDFPPDNVKERLSNLLIALMFKKAAISQKLFKNVKPKQNNRFLRAYKHVLNNY